MTKLTRTQTSLIFKARTRMLNIKDNMRGGYKENMTCRICNTDVETQKHIFEECSKLHVQNNTKIPEEELFTEDINTLKSTAGKIADIMEIIEKTKNTKGKKRKATGLPQQRAKKRRKTDKEERTKPTTHKGKKRKATGAPQYRAKKKRKTEKPIMDETLREIVDRMIAKMRQEREEQHTLPNPRQNPIINLPETPIRSPDASIDQHPQSKVEQVTERTELVRDHNSDTEPSTPAQPLRHLHPQMSTQLT